MGKKLLITEKPSVAMEFSKVIGENFNRSNGYLESPNWIITWCVGHLVTMSYPEKYDENLKFWRLDTLPFIPTEWKYEVIENVQNQFNVVQKLMQREDIDTIYNAGDSGREGEYIQRLVQMMANPNPKAERKRVWIDSQTEEEIRRGIAEAKDNSEYDSLADSAYLRAKEDYLIGINFSRMLSIIYGRKLAKEINEEKASISVGRVMTCVLGMVVEREREIRNFKKTPYFKLEACFDGFKAEWRDSEKSRFHESPKLYNDSGFKSEEDVKEFILALKDKEAVVEEIKKSSQKEKAPLLFNLAEIQNECSRRFKISPDETLEVIQNLYEKKLVTYPRTDARVLSTAVAKVIKNNLNGIAKGYKNDEFQTLIKHMAERKYSLDLVKTKYVDDKKITDHYAIVPTGQGFENFEKLPQLHKDVYDLIVHRFLAIFFPPAEFNKLNITIDIDGEKFYATARECKDEGYMEAWKKSAKPKKDDSEAKEGDNKAEDAEEDDENQNNILNISLKKGEKLTVGNYEIKQSETTPPSRYNSGSMILAMENAGKLIEDEELREQIKSAGIGTSATRGGIIAKLAKIQYIAINGKTQIITPTQKGEYIYDIVKIAMPDLLNPELTASWEKGLDMVAKKEIQPEVFMDKLTDYINKKFDKLVIKR